VSTAIQKQGQQSPKAKTDAFMHEVVTRKTTFQRLLPKGMDPDWFTAEVRVAVARAPKLLECDRVSVIDALTTCAQLGLSPSGRLGSAYLIPYGQKCQLVVGYRGMCDLAYRSGEIISIGAQVVHENDVFEPNEGFDLTIRHVRTEDDPGALRAVYAWAQTRGGGTIKCLMLRREVEPIKRASLAKKRQGAPPTPWETNEEEMWKKTCLRRMFKVSPLSPQKAQGLARALEAEDAEFEDIAADVSGPDETPTTGTEGLKRQLMAGSRGERVEEAVTERPEPLPISHHDAQPPKPGAEG
jgi:recombination protein RecT